MNTYIFQELDEVISKNKFQEKPDNDKYVLITWHIDFIFGKTI